MANVNFYLKKKEPKSGKSLIYLQFIYANNKITFSFGQTINPQDWDKKKQRVKRNVRVSVDGNYELNELLENLKELCLRSYYEGMKNGYPAPETIKTKLSAFIKKDTSKTTVPTLFELIQQFINNEVKFQGKNKSKNTLKTYQTSLNHLKGYSAHIKAPITYDDINLTFYSRYIDYLINQGLGVNSRGKEIKNLKTFMGEAVDRGYTTNDLRTNKKFHVSREDSESVYLTIQDIQTLYSHDFANNKRLAQIRDLFVFNCSVGLRYSDLCSLKKEDIKWRGEDIFIEKVTTKTKHSISIPCDEIASEILNRYKNTATGLPYCPSNQKFNEYIKEVCKEAGLKEKGRLISNSNLELWEIISTHTARRSFATNRYLAGIPVVELMKFTGHRNERAFSGYLKLNHISATNRLKEYNKQTKSKPTVIQSNQLN